MSDSFTGTPEANGVAADKSTDVPAKRRISPLRRLGCGLLLLCWFALLMTPCALFYLAANGEIRLWHADIPQPHQHPALLLSLISDSDNRGLRIEASYLSGSSATELSTCVQTVVSYILWHSQAGDQNVSYCDCYRRRSAEYAWVLDDSFAGTCHNERQAVTR